MAVPDPASAPANRPQADHTAALPAPRNHSRRSGLETSWMLGLEDRLLSSMVSKSLGMSDGAGEVVFLSTVATLQRARLPSQGAMTTLQCLDDASSPLPQVPRVTKPPP